MTSPWIRRTVNVTASLVAPFAMQAILVVINRELRPPVPDIAGLISVGSSAAVGFAFLAYEFGIYSLIIALAYFPVMAIVLIGFSLDVVGWIYHDYL